MAEHIITALEEIKTLLDKGDKVELSKLFDNLNSQEIIYSLGHLNKTDQMKLLSLLSPEGAADVIEEIPDYQAKELIEDMTAGDAAAILNEMGSDEQADLLMDLDEQDAEAILQEMDVEEAEDARRLILHHADTAGGMMVTEFMVFDDQVTVRDVKDQIRAMAAEVKRYYVRYVYVNDSAGKFSGVLQMQDLLLAQPSEKLSSIVLKDVLSVKVDTPLDELSDFFDTYDFFGVPVIDSFNHLVGVVLRKSVLEAVSEKQTIEHLETQGIVGGDELRTMPVFLRSKRRLSWLSVNILLNIVAASVIAFHQEVLSSVIALAVFLPIISDMSGCSGNQAVAVSMRELSIGVVRPEEYLRVWFQEVSVGLINGLALGLLLGVAAFLWKGNVVLGLVVGGALMINTIVAVSIGGTVPLYLKNSE